MTLLKFGSSFLRSVFTARHAIINQRRFHPFRNSKFFILCFNFYLLFLVCYYLLLFWCYIQICSSSDQRYLFFPLQNILFYFTSTRVLKGCKETNTIREKCDKSTPSPRVSFLLLETINSYNNPTFCGFLSLRYLQLIFN